MKRLTRLLPFIAALAAFVALVPALLAQTSPVYTETFDGAPQQPQPWQNPHNWDIVVLGFDARVGSEDPQRQSHNVAGHGPNCEAPGFPFTPTNTHQMRSALDMVFICGVGAGTHLMTGAGICGYCAVYMTPPVVADMSQGPAQISIDMSTLRTSPRDWVQWVLTPDDGHHELAFISTDQHMPANYVKIEMAGTNVFIIKQRVNGGQEMAVSSDTFTTYDTVLARQVPPLLTSMARRDTFQATISPTRLSFCMPKYAFCWANDVTLPVPLDPAIWHNKVQQQINHVSYNAQKGCEQAAFDAGFNVNELEDQFGIVNSDWTFQRCPPSTWHWDNLTINPAIPYVVIPAVPATFETFSSAPTTVNFAAPAPAGARLSFLAWGDTPQLRVSYDGGATWLAPRFQPSLATAHQEYGEQVYTSIPEGQRSIMLRGSPSWVQFIANTFKIVGAPGGAPAPIPTSPPTPTVPPATATAMATIQATAVPTSTPTATPTLVPATATAAATQTMIAEATLTAEPTLLPSPTPTMTPTPEPPPTATPGATVVGTPVLPLCSVTIRVDAENDTLTIDPGVCANPG